MNLPRDVEDDGKGDCGERDIDQTQVGDITKHLLKESRDWIQNAVRDDVQAR